MIWFRNLCFIACLVWLAISDFKTRRIPNAALMLSAAVWCFAAFFAEEPLQYLLTGLITAAALAVLLFLLTLLTEKLLKKETLGGGDVKLLAVVGLYFGPVGSLYVLAAACALGLVLWAIFRRVRPEEPYFPFGPAIALASAVLVFFAEKLA